MRAQNGFLAALGMGNGAGKGGMVQEKGKEWCRKRGNDAGKGEGLVQRR